MTIIVLVVLGGCVAGASVFGVTIDWAGGRIYNPQAEAQATRTAQLAADEAAAREIERQAQQAEADAAMAARPAMAARNAMAALAGGAGALVLVVGGAFALVAWLNKRATAVYPNAAGQYPVIVRRGWGWITFHDPNRGLGPAAVYKTPTMLDQLASVVLALRTGAQLERQQPEASFPAPGSEGAMVQIASQAQAGQVAAAQNRWPRLPNVVGGRISVSERGASGLADSPTLPEPASRMPQITIIDDPVRVANMRQQQLECGQ